MRTALYTNDRALRRTMRVVGTGDGWTALESERASACSACAARSGCGAGALSEMMAAGPARIVVPQTTTAQTGDEIEVAMAGGVFLRASALAYLLPPAALALVAAAGLAAGWSDAVVAALCAPTLALSLLPLAFAGKSRAGDGLTLFAPASVGAPDAPETGDEDVR